MDAEGNGIHLAQSGYEKELLERWKPESGSDFPMIKLGEADFEAVETIDTAVLKEAQALRFTVAVNKDSSRPGIWGRNDEQVDDKEPTKSFRCWLCSPSLHQVKPWRFALLPGHAQ